MQLKTLVIVLLISQFSQFSGIAPALAATMTSPSLESLVRRARYPFAVGSEPGKPTLADLAVAERELLVHRSELENRFKLLSSDEKLAAINSYMNQVSLLASLRIALQLSHGLDWARLTALHLPKELLPELPILGATAQNKLGDRFAPLIIDREIDSNRFELRISAALIQGLELGQLADHPNSEAYLTVVQYLSIRQLLQNLAEVRTLKKSHTVAQPQISTLLTRKMESLKLMNTLAEESRRASAEPGAKAALSKGLNTILSSPQTPPQFVTPELVSELVQVIAPKKASRLKVEAALLTALEDAENTQTLNAFEEEMSTSAAPFSLLPPLELEALLRSTFASAKTNTVLQRIMELMAMGILSDLEISSRKEILSILEQAKERYSPSIRDRFFTAWRRAARQAPESTLFEAHRLQFVTELMGTAGETLEETQKLLTFQKVHIPSLFSVFHADRKALGNRSASTHFDAWIYELQTAADYPAAQLRFQQRALRFYSDGNHPAQLHFSQDVPTELSEKISKRIEAGRRKDKTAYLTLGKMLGFTEVSAKTASDPSALLAQILPQEGQVERYFAALRESTQANQPLLATHVLFRGSTTTLAEALVSINPNATSNKIAFNQSEDLVEQALDQVEISIHQNIQKISQATRLEEIEKVVNNSMMMSLIFRGFRELAPVQNQWLRQATSPSTTEMLMHRYVSGYLTWGGSALMLILGGKWLTQMTLKRAFPYADLVAMAADGVLAGYMRSFTPVLLADTAYQAGETWGVHSETEESESLFASSATAEGGLVDTSELSEARTAYQIAKWSFVARMGMDTALMYLPMMRGLAKARGDDELMRQLMQNSEDFSRLGLKGDAFEQIEQGLQHVRLEARTDIKLAEEAAARLIERRSSGQTYSLDTTFKKLLIEDAFQTLLLNTSKASSWLKIDEALQLVTHSGKSLIEIRTAENAAEFLKTLLKKDSALPQRLATDARSIRPYERKLAEALGRSHSLDREWKEALRGTL